VLNIFSMSLKVSSLTVDSVPCGTSSVQPHLAAEDTSGAHTTHMFGKCEEIASCC